MPISKFVKIRLSVAWIKYLTSKEAGFRWRVQKKNTPRFWGKIVRENWNFDIAGNCVRSLTSQRSCQILRKFCIDNSTAKFISLAVQIYLAGLAIANRPFYSCPLSDLAFVWQRGRRWPCFDTDLSAFVMYMRLVSIRTTWFTQQKQWVCIKTRSPPVSLPYKGQVTERKKIMLRDTNWTNEAKTNSKTGL